MVLTINDKTDKFKIKAFIKHNGKYSYPKTIFNKSHEKLIVTCEDHGDFLITPANHLSGQGCTKCARINTINGRKSNLTKFIEKAFKIHGNKYGYKNFIYKNNKTKGKIKCNICMCIFEQKPDNHLQGQGCPNCAKYNLIYNHPRLLNQEEVIKRFIEVHGNKYGYKNFIYKNNKTKSWITCDKHGDFLQSSGHHLEGKGCPKCAAIKIGNLTRLTLEEFIQKARAIHGNKFDYSKVIYINNETKVIIICHKHGEFKQTPANHLRKQGCPICNSSKGELAIKAILKKYNIVLKNQYKIPEIANRFEYDFYLPEYNLLIEFQGIQHYKAIEFFGGEDNLEYVQRNDKIKKHLAYIYKYRYLEFNYKQLKYMSKEQFEELVLNNINKFKKITIFGQQKHL